MMKHASESYGQLLVLTTLFNLEGARDGGIAQLGEHLLCKQGVSGSIPLISTRSGEVNTPPKTKWAHSSAG